MSIQLEWLIFGILVFVLLALDLLIFNKKPHEVKFKEALGWSAFWIFLGLAFGGFVYYEHGSELALQYYAAYFMEKSLSIDNIFVFLMIFSFFKVAPMYQHKVLFWGIIGALAMRFIFIFLGIGLINTFDWILYVFGAVLIYSGYKMLKEKDSEYDPSKNKMISLFRKIMPVTDEFHEQKFFVRLNGVLHATPLFHKFIT